MTKTYRLLKKEVLNLIIVLFDYGKAHDDKFIKNKIHR